MATKVDWDKYVFTGSSIIPPDNMFPDIAPNNPHVMYLDVNKESQFHYYLWPIVAPCRMEQKTFYHDFDQMLIFCGSDMEDRHTLGGVVELTLGFDMNDLRKFTIKEPTVIYVKAGMLHCPLTFVEVYDPKKPILFQDITLHGLYSKFIPGDPQRRNEKCEPIDEAGNVIR